MENTPIILLARNEGAEPFKVTFTRRDGRLTVTCTCPAGIHGEFCDHKFRLASNDVMMLEHPGQNSAMLNAHVWVIESALSDPLLTLLNLLGEEKPDEEAIGKAKAAAGAAMRDGTETTSL